MNHQQTSKNTKGENQRSKSEHFPREFGLGFAVEGFGADLGFHLSTRKSWDPGQSRKLLKRYVELLDIPILIHPKPNKTPTPPQKKKNKVCWQTI